MNIKNVKVAWLKISKLLYLSVSLLQIQVVHHQITFLSKTKCPHFLPYRHHLLRKNISPEIAFNIENMPYTA